MFIQKVSCIKLVIVEVDAIAKGILCMRRIIRYNFSVFFTNEQSYVLWLCLCNAKLYFINLAIFEVPLCNRQSRPSFFTDPLPKVTKIPL